MKEIIFCIILFPFLGQAQWSKQTSNTTEVLNNTHFTDNSNGFSVGNNGVMVKTANGGNNWSTVNTGLSSGQLLGVFFVERKTGWICGTNGILNKTIDSGANWTSYSTGFSTYLSGIYFTSKSTGFTVGQNGKVMRTTDSGKTWSSQTVTTRNFINVYFRDSLNGYACGGYNTIISTTDGGSSWRVMHTDSLLPEALYSVKFINDKIGYTVGTHGTILKTTDGGLNWVNQKSGHTKSLYSIYFLDSLNGWVTCNQDDSILKTTDGGKNWVSSTLNYATGYNCVYFPSKSTGYLVGKNGAIFKLSNGMGIHAKAFNESRLSIYPNPSVGLVSIQSVSEIYGYTVYDIYGRVMVTRNFNSGTNDFTIDISEFFNADYILELKGEGGILRKEKLIIGK